MTRDGHRTWFKWHRGRRRLDDPVFTGSRIVEAMALGASVEVDLVVHADGGFAVLHDLELGRESTGTGRVAERGAAELRALRLRDNQGRVTDEPVMLLEDLSALLARRPIHPGTLLQLDYKQDAAVLDTRMLAGFAASTALLGRHVILSSGDAAAVDLLSAAAPAIRLGYDPCHDGALERLERTRDFVGFVAAALAASPRAEMIYLHHEMVLAVADAGFDMIGAFHAAGRRVDAYTLGIADPETAARAERLLALHVDQITTDDPEGLAAALSPSPMP